MKKFIELLSDPILATSKQREKEIWDVEGRLKNANQPFKFDIRPLKQVDNKAEKIGTLNLNLIRWFLKLLISGSYLILKS